MLNLEIFDFPNSWRNFIVDTPETTTRVNSEVTGYSEREIEAVTKIQAAYKGYKIRKNIVSCAKISYNHQIISLPSVNL